MRGHIRGEASYPALIVMIALFVASRVSGEQQRCLGRETVYGQTAGQSTGKGIAQCLSCHDGTVASNITLLNQADGGELSGSGEHPVGIDYAQAYLKKPGALRRPEEIDKRLTLIDGKVHCLSCHDLTVTTKGMLSMPNQGSALCLACHMR